jgi:hypothetical protein
MNPQGIPEAAMWQLLEQSQLSDSEVHDRLRNALSQNYWQHLNPELAIEGQDSIPEHQPIDTQSQADLRQRFANQGYIQVPPLLSPERVDPMQTCVSVLRAAGWPPVFAFVYDRFWQIWRSPSLVGLFSHILGTDYRQTFHVWTHYVPARDGAAGWPPHMDGYQEHGKLTVWIPLSDATLNNGCIYVIPKKHFPPDLANRMTTATLSWADVEALLQGSRALPAIAGSVLCWDYDLMHWGSICDRAEHPRMSIAITLISHQVDLQREKPSFAGAGRLPTFEERLAAIAVSLKTYQGREPLMIRYLKLAQALSEQFN